MMKKKSALVSIFVFALVMVGAAPNTYAEDNSGCKPLQTAVTDLNTGSGISGQARLCYGDTGVQVRMSAKNLIAGQAYTVWFVYFNDPSTCITAPGTAEPCGPPDLTSPLPSSTNPNAAPAGVFGRMDAAVADQEGTARFTARLRDFHASPGSRVHLVIFNHGSASDDNYSRARQLLTPETPGLGSPGLGLGTRKGFMAGGAIFDIPTSSAD